MTQAWLPDYIYTNGRFRSGIALVADNSGKIVELTENAGNATRLTGRAMLPGLVNAHSHAFQRIIRGRTEYRSQNASDSFWTWREQMYVPANRLEPEVI
jgi:formimidoylglutamate deiminase